MVELASVGGIKWCQSDFSSEISYKKSFRCANGMQFKLLILPELGLSV